MQMNAAERAFYEDRLKWLRDESSVLKTARTEGEQFGLKKGKVEGEQIALKKVAMNLLAAGNSPDQTAQLTGLTLTAIQSLQVSSNGE